LPGTTDIGRVGGASFITDSWKKPVLLLTHGCQEPYYYCAYTHGPLLKAIMLHFEAVQVSIIWGGGGGGPKNLKKRKGIFFSGVIVG